MAKITSIVGRILYNSRGSKTIEVDIESDGGSLGRVCAPSGASVGKYEAVSFPNGKPEESLRILNENSQKFIGLESSDLKGIHDTLKSLDKTDNYSDIGGALAFAVTIASMESAAKLADALTNLENQILNLSQSIVAYLGLIKVRYGTYVKEFP